MGVGVYINENGGANTSIASNLHCKGSASGGLDLQGGGSQPYFHRVDVVSRYRLIIRTTAVLPIRMILVLKLIRVVMTTIMPATCCVVNRQVIPVKVRLTACPLITSCHASLIVYLREMERLPLPGQQ
ncbi:MAG: hypothetical protein QM751_10465 [Paludibacteraceae bacterium]